MKHTNNNDVETKDIPNAKSEVTPLQETSQEANSQISEIFEGAIKSNNTERNFQEIEKSIAELISYETAKNLNWAELTEHPLCKKFPEVSEKAYKALLDDIYLFGLKVKITIYNGQIILGRARYKALIELGIQLSEDFFIEYQGNEEDIEDLIISDNIKRHHLTKSQLACIASVLYTERKKQTIEELRIKISNIRRRNNQYSYKPPTDNAEYLENIFGVSSKYITEAEKLRKTNTELFDEVLSGAKNLYQAMKSLNKSNSIKIEPELETEENSEDSENFPKPEDEMNPRGINTKLVKIEVNKEFFSKIMKLATDKETTLFDILEEMLEYYKNKVEGESHD